MPLDPSYAMARVAETHFNRRHVRLSDLRARELVFTDACPMGSAAGADISESKANHMRCQARASRIEDGNRARDGFKSRQRDVTGAPLQAHEFALTTRRGALYHGLPETK
jgi:hypothetical protein